MDLLIQSHLMQQSVHPFLLRMYHFPLPDHYQWLPLPSQLQILPGLEHLPDHPELGRHPDQVIIEVERRGQVLGYLQEVKVPHRPEVHCGQKHADYVDNHIRITNLTYTIISMLRLNISNW